MIRLPSYYSSPHPSTHKHADTYGKREREKEQKKENNKTLVSFLLVFVAGVLINSFII